jgi:hypothetical protein
MGKQVPTIQDSLERNGEAPVFAENAGHSYAEDARVTDAGTYKMTDVHPVVTLLIKRIESHPEEFGRNSDRWDWIAERVQTHGSAEERAAIKEALRPIRLQELHEEMMDELCNGDERRRKEEADREYEKQLVRKMQLQNISQQIQQQQQQAQAYANQTGIGSVTPSHPLVFNAGGKEAMRITANGQLNIGGETLDAGIIKKIKGALKI